MSTPVIGYDELHPPKLVTCPGCGRERLSRQDHPGFAGDSAPCGDCRRLLGVMDAAAVALKITHPSLAAQLRTEMGRMERTD